MNTPSISETLFEAPWVEYPKPGAACAPSEFVKAFGNRVFSVAKHITQNDEDAEDVLIEAFLEACSDWDACQDEERLWLRLVTVAVREAFSKLRKRLTGQCLRQVADPCEDLVVRELSVWADDYQQRDSKEQTTHVLENGLRVWIQWLGRFSCSEISTKSQSSSLQGS